MSDVISKLLELSDGDYVRYDDVVKALQAMQGDADTKTYTNLCQKGSAPQPAVPEVDVNQQLVEALKDMLSGWRYIREVHGDLYGVGWDRAQKVAEKALLSAGKETK